MEEKKFNVSLQEGANEIIWREGQAPRTLDPKAPIKIDLRGVIGSPVEFLSKRITEKDQIDPKRTHVTVNRETLTIVLVISEHDEYNCGQVTGTLKIHPKFEEFGINQGKTWLPIELGQFFKMNRSFFSNREENMKLVSDLKNFNAKVSSTMNQAKDEKGSMNVSYKQIVNSNLPDIFTLNIPIFKGMKATQLQVEAYATVDGSDAFLQLFSPSANQLIEEMRDEVIDAQIKAIKDLSPDIVIIEQ